MIKNKIPTTTATEFLGFYLKRIEKPPLDVNLKEKNFVAVIIGIKNEKNIVVYSNIKITRKNLKKAEQNKFNIREKTENKN